MVRSKYGQRTIFSVVVDHREYFITAKHVLTGAEHPPYGSIKTKSVTIKILYPAAKRDPWLPETFRVIDPGNNVDIVVLAPRNRF